MATPLAGVLLLAAFTGRSQAYAQALARSGLAPDGVVTFGEASSLPGASPGVRIWQGVALHDPGEPLGETCAAAGWPAIHCPADSVNADEVAVVLAARRPRLVIYSGRGGEIVGERLLGLGSQFLHLHTGWLPEYRGSTTIYYALLNGDPPAASAIVLDRTIDTGPIVARRTYPRPPAGMDIDRLYDHALRADLLVRVMQHYASTGALPAGSPQRGDQEQPYYVIHPVLKHAALLALEAP